MLKDSSISLGKIKKWLDEEYGLKHKDFGAIYLSEYARKNKMTNTEFLRGHLLARAQGEAVQEKIEKEEKTEQEKLESKNN